MFIPRTEEHINSRENKPSSSVHKHQSKNSEDSLMLISISLMSDLQNVSIHRCSTESPSASESTSALMQWEFLVFRVRLLKKISSPHSHHYKLLKVDHTSELNRSFLSRSVRVRVKVLEHISHSWQRTTYYTDLLAVHSTVFGRTSPDLQWLLFSSSTQLNCSFS